jgi:pilus assembly protein CpaF
VSAWGRAPTGFGGRPTEAEQAPTDARAYQAIKVKIHQTLLGNASTWRRWSGSTPERLKEELRQMVERLLVEENLVLNAGERRNLVRDIQHEMLGLGPLEPLLADPTVSDILINTHKPGVRRARASWS